MDGFELGLERLLGNESQSNSLDVVEKLNSRKPDEGPSMLESG
jgi:hypothetical protein